MPVRLTKPNVGRMPTRLLADAGERIELIVSVPIPSSPKFAARPAPVPPTGAPRRSGQVIGVAGLAPKRADGLAPDSELVQVGLGEDNRASLFQLLDDSSVVRRHIVLEA